MKSKIRQKSAIGFSPAYFFAGSSSISFFLVLALLVFIFGLFKPQAISDLRMATTDLFSPFISAIASPFQNMASAITDVSDIAELKAENKRLMAENERLKEWYQTALMLEAENKSLQQMLNLKIDTDYNYVTARTLSDASNPYVKTLLISSGAQDGIEKNQAVLSGEGMIGRIMEVGERTARILLITDINSRVPVMIEGSQQRAILIGKNTLFPELKYIPAESSLQMGARVITSGDGDVFPSGFPIGRLAKNDKGYIFVRPFSNLQNVTYVRVVQKKERDTASLKNIGQNNGEQ